MYTKDLGRRCENVNQKKKRRCKGKKQERDVGSNGINNSLLPRVILSETLGGVCDTFSTCWHKGKVLMKEFLIVGIRGMWGCFGECAERGMWENQRMKERRGSQVSAKTQKTLSHHTPAHEELFRVNLMGSFKIPKSFTQTLMGGSINSMCWRKIS